MKSYHNM